MKPSYFIWTFVFSMLLTACGGGDGGNTGLDEQVQDQPTLTATKSGIYYNEADFVLALIDKDAIESGLIVVDQGEGALFRAKATTAGTNTMTTQGIYYQSSGVTISTGGNPTTATFTSQGLEYDVDSLSAFGATSYSALKETDSSLPFSDLMNGSFTGGFGGGEQIQIDSIGNITISLNNGCTFDSSAITRTNDLYYSASSLTASGCANASENTADYALRLFTAKHQSADYIFAVIYNNTVTHWTTIQK